MGKAQRDLRSLSRIEYIGVMTSLLAGSALGVCNISSQGRVSSLIKAGQLVMAPIMLLMITLK
ncbi:MAG: hypothetical protein P1U63_05955 [Coxiellaceae bacterium]|nr:hypothetical protein [Coxiellaceae bacterium]